MTQTEQKPRYGDMRNVDVRRFYTVREYLAALRNPGDAYVVIVDGPRPGSAIQISKREARDFVRPLARGRMLTGHVRTYEQFGYRAGSGGWMARTDVYLDGSQG